MVLNLPNRGAPSEPKDRSDEFVANWEEKVEDFDQTELALDLLHGIYSSGYQHPSEVQSLAIRPICMHRNVVVCASEASGKTSALVMGILNNIDVQLKETQALVLSPMGMLAQHVYEMFAEIGSRMKGLKVRLFKGGSPIGADRMAATSCPHVVVATPGRAGDLIRTGHMKTQQLKMLCLDDADDLLKGDMQEQVSEIVGLAEQHVQFLLSSTKMTDPVFAIMKGIADPVQIKVQAQGTWGPQYFANSAEEQYKFSTVIYIYGQLSVSRCVIFANRKKTVNELQEALEREHISVAAIHAGLSQDDSGCIMQRFRKGEVRVLITTDDFAKCIHPLQPSLVINYELPKDAEQYRRRVASGVERVVVNICTFEDAEGENFKDSLEQRYQTHIEELPVDLGKAVSEYFYSAK